MASKSELDLQGMLLSTGMVQPVKISSWGGRLSALCRLMPRQETEWLQLLEQLLQVAEGREIPIHVCKQFVLKDGKMVAGWHLAIEGKSASRLKTALEVLGVVFAAHVPGLEAPSRVPELPAPVATKVTESIPSEEYDEEAELVPETADIVARRKAYLAKTNAAPRTPPPAPAIDLPILDPASAAKRVVARSMTTDSKGRSRQVVIEEMPLPGVYTDDMNKPNEKNRGATKLG